MWFHREVSHVVLKSHFWLLSRRGVCSVFGTVNIMVSLGKGHRENRIGHRRAGSRDNQSGALSEICFTFVIRICRNQNNMIITHSLDILYKNTGVKINHSHLIITDS